ncbi:TKL family protein kinase [Histomonas meleagridis]|uniref:TKL family protein kinase n=1 Tax=Histomonas meleagridis TaxID=135588 RepID=UPI00355A5702|nr:TKL family protein kinase [Histomonas meleagridis]KAH0806868.1 TKL family protein kinase [Histomonas meleagridis]
MSIHARFSINLDEDYELFGIDPNENLDDWSFLDAKPKPIEEKTEEEKQLFQRLLTPTISEEEIQTKIHDKLKTLIKETSDFIKNDLKVELSEPIELPPEEVKKQIDENSFEHKQAVRMSTIVKDIFETTQKAENITDFVKDITRSDEIAKEIETSQTDNNIIETPPKPKEVPPQITEVPKDIQPIKEEQHEHKASNFLNRYTKKRNPINTILKEQEETERMKSKFLQERKKREEAAAAEIELQKKSMQEKQKQFFDDIEKEVEKHRREIQMVNEVKNSHQPSTAEILNQIKQQETPKVEIKQKQIKKERSKPKPPILTGKMENEVAIQKLTEVLQPFLYQENDFKNKTQIGGGTFGRVYSAINKKTNKKVAIKELNILDMNPNSLRYFLLEIQTMASCDCPFLVPFVGFTNKQPYSIISEFIPNGSLHQAIMKKDSNIRLSSTNLSIITIGIAMGIQYLHSKSIIHRDLKPSNILLNSKLYPMICDLGYARFQGEIDQAPMTESVGTIHFMAPEVLVSNEYDFKADIFSYALLLYEVCERKKPFTNCKTINDYYNRVCKNNERPEFKKTSPVLQELITKCWDPEPEKRYTADEVVQYLISNYKSLFHKSNVKTIQRFIKSARKAIVKNSKPKLDPSNIVLVEPQFYHSKSHSSFNSVSSRGTYSEGNFTSSNFSACLQPTSSETSKTDKSFDEEFYKSLIEYNKFDFKSAIDRCKNHLQPKDSSTAIQAFLYHFKNSSPEPVLSEIFKTIINMINRNSSFAEKFCSESFILSLPLDEKHIDKTLQIFQQLILKSLDSIKEAHSSLIEAFLNDRPVQFMPFIKYVINSSIQSQTSNPFIENLLRLTPKFKDKPVGADLIYALTYLSAKNENFSKSNIITIDNMLINFLSSNCTSNVYVSYALLCNMVTDLSVVDSDILIAHLHQKNFCKFALSLMLRLPKITINDELVPSLLGTFQFDVEDDSQIQNAWLMLFRLAEDPESSQLVLNNLNLFNLTMEYPKECWNTFIILFMDVNNIEFLANEPFFVPLLKAVIALNDTFFTESVITVLLRCPMEEDFVYNLSNSLILKDIIGTCSTSNNGLLKYKCMLLIDYIARSGIYTPEFLSFNDTLISLLSNKEYYTFAMLAFVSLSFHSKCAQAFKRNKRLVEYFTKVSGYPKFKKVADMFLAHVRKA